MQVMKFLIMQFPIMSSLLGPNILHLILTILNSGSSFSVRQQEYKIIGRITMIAYFNLYSFIYQMDSQQIPKLNVMVAVAAETALVVSLQMHKILSIFT